MADKLQLIKERQKQEAEALKILKGEIANMQPTENDKVLFNFVKDGARVEIHGTENKEYEVNFIDDETMSLLHTDTIKSGEWCRAPHQYYVKWRLQVFSKKDNTIVRDFVLDLKGKNVMITYESSALGDSLCWIEAMEYFRKKHECNLFVSSFQNELLEPIYPNIKFIPRGVPIQGIHVVYRVGFFGDGTKSERNPRDCRHVPMFTIATDILGISEIEYKEMLPNLRKDKRTPVIPKNALGRAKKYVVITTCSTAQFKYWNRKNGWQDLVDWFNGRGYTVVNVGKMPNTLKNVIPYTGKREMADLINVLQNAEYFIGLPSGLAWLARCLGKKTVMITGISYDWCEYRKDCYRVESKEEGICHGCFNWGIKDKVKEDGTTETINYAFRKDLWLWCPEHQHTPRHFECTATITPEQVQETCMTVEKHLKYKNTHWSMSDQEVIDYLNTDKIKLTAEDRLKIK